MSGIDQLPERWRNRIRIDADTGCWIWTGARHSHSGYGRTTVLGRPDRAAHRAIYETLVGSVPAGLVLDHLCRVTYCVCPNHLEVVTFTENVRRGFGAPAMRGRAENCPNGHAYSPENTTFYTRDGRRYRRCITCHKAAQLRFGSAYKRERKAVSK